MTSSVLSPARRLFCTAALGVGFDACAGPQGRRRGATQAGARYAGQASIAAFATEVSKRRELPARWLLGRLELARRNEAVRRLITPPPAGTAKNWRAYRDRFVEPQRVAAGLAFWRANERALDEAEARFGVPPEVVLGIVGVETFYGRVMGSFRVIDALATLAFDFPHEPAGPPQGRMPEGAARRHSSAPPGRRDRSGFFRAELEEFFVWCAREGRDPVAPLGSYAGAMGLPQFMPSSINRYALDFDGDGRIDLVGNGADVVGSVARYLAEFGWQAGGPTHFAATAPAAPEDLAVLREKDILPSFAAAQLVARGVGLDEAARAHAGPLAFVELENGGQAPTHVAGTANFYAITRYNWSSYYAMAVIELAQALKAVRAAPTS